MVADKPAEFRRANEGDLERLLEIHTSAFPDPRGPESRRRNFLYNIFGDLQDLRVAEVGGVIVAHAFLFPLELGFGGARVRAGGIASVGVAPEARGTGVGSALVEHLHAQSRQRSDAITVLYAFRQGFYARQGYAPVTSSRRLHLSPRAVPAAWRALGAARAVSADDLPAIIGCYERAVARSTGFIVRAQRFWDARFMDDRRRWFAVGDGRSVRGYVSWTVSQPEAHAKTTMLVHDLVYDDDGAMRALYGLIGAQRDQCAEVELDVAAGDPIERALVDADQMRYGTEKVEHVLGEIVGGPMVRLVDVARALVARGYLRDGALDIATESATLGLQVRDGRGHLGPTGKAPTIHASDEGLAAVLYGALSTSDAARLGWVSGDAAALAAGDALLSLPPYFALDPF